MQSIPSDIDSDTVKYTLRGVDNLQVGLTETRTGCTVMQLAQLCEAAKSIYEKYEGCLVTSMFTMAFYGFLRVSEYSDSKAGHAILRSCCKIIDE